MQYITEDTILEAYNNYEFDEIDLIEAYEEGYISENTMDILIEEGVFDEIIDYLYQYQILNEGIINRLITRGKYNASLAYHKATNFDNRNKRQIKLDQSNKNISIAKDIDRDEIKKAFKKSLIKGIGKKLQSVVGLGKGTRKLGLKDRLRMHAIDSARPILKTIGASLPIVGVTAHYGSSIKKALQ